MRKLLLILFAAALMTSLPLVHAVEHEWTNKQGKTINAEFVSATNEAVTISMQGKVFVVKLADLSPQSRALAAKLRVQKSTVQKPGIVAEAPKVVVDSYKLNRRDGLFYFEEKPFTGVAVKKYPNGEKKEEVTYKDGKWHGLWTFWYENGQKEMEYTFKDGEAHGLHTGWYSNGQKSGEATFKDGIGISYKEWDKDGKPERPPSQDRGATKPEAEAPKVVVKAPKVVVDGDQLEDRDDLWYFEGKPFTGVAVGKYPNEQKYSEITYKDGEWHGLATYWYENGQKGSEATYKDGVVHGLMTLWHENGQKQSERTFKDGIGISYKEWDKDGNLIE